MTLSVCAFIYFSISLDAFASVAVVVVSAARKLFSNIHRIVGTRTHVARCAPANCLCSRESRACKWKATLRRRRRRRRWNIWIMKLIRCNLFTFVLQHKKSSAVFSRCARRDSIVPGRSFSVFHTLIIVVRLMVACMRWKMNSVHMMTDQMHCLRMWAASIRGLSQCVVLPQSHRWEKKVKLFRLIQSEW